MKIKALILISFFLPTFLNAQKNKNTLVEYDYSNVQLKIAEAVKSKRIPSMVIAVAKKGKIIYKEAFGYSDIENSIQATITTSYQLASVSKPMTATAIMKLYSEGKIHIDSLITKYLPGYKFKKRDRLHKDPTIRQLLNHTSGLGTYFDIGYSDEKRSFDNFEEAWKKYGTLFHKPGEVCEYSNLGYGLLDKLITEVSGVGFDRYMKNEIFKPLEMTHSFVDNSDNKLCSIAVKYDYQSERLPEVINNTLGAGNIYSSVHDLIHFGMFHIRSFKKHSLLDKKELNEMHFYFDEKANYHYYEDTYYSLGWYCRLNDNGNKIIWHEGGMMGASSMIKLIPEKEIAIAVITNTYDNPFCREITDEISKVVHPEYNPSVINEIADYLPYSTDSTLLGKWTGHFKVDDIEIPCNLTFENNRIIIDYQDYTYKSFFTQDYPISNQSVLAFGVINKNSFLGMFPGNIPSSDIRNEFSQFLSLKLLKKGNLLEGTIVAAAAAPREYYSYPYAIILKKEKE